jgi:hypothetical protein
MDGMEWNGKHLFNHEKTGHQKYINNTIILEHQIKQHQYHEIHEISKFFVCLIPPLYVEGMGPRKSLRTIQPRPTQFQMKDIMMQVVPF